jgi:hypothetical protein
MPTRSAAQKTLLAGAALCFACAHSFAQSPSDPVAGLSPDERPTLIVQLPPDALMLSRHPNLSATQRLALSLGLRARPRDTIEPLPSPWRTVQPDRGLAQELSAALDRSQANWPWRGLQLLADSDQVDRQLAGLSGEDVAIARLGFELDDLGTRVQFAARADVTIVRALGTARETRTRILLRHLAVPLAAQAEHAQRSAAQFRAGGALDQCVDSAALDLSRLLAVMIARAEARGAAPAGRRFKDLAHPPDCSECRPDDVILHEEPGRVWIAATRSPGLILSLPLPQS